MTFTSRSIALGILLGILVSFLPISVSAQTGTTTATTVPTVQSGFIPLVTIPNLTEGVLPTQTGLATFLNNLYKYLVGIAAIIAVIQIMRAGIMITVQSDSVSKHSEGIDIIKKSLGGLVLVLSPALVFSIINPSILNLSLNIPPLDTAPRATIKTVTPAPEPFTLPGNDSPIYPCSGDNCTAARDACQKNVAQSGLYSAQIVCMQANGNTIGSTRTGGIFSSGTYSCPTAHTMVVQCVMNTNPVAP